MIILSPRVRISQMYVKTKKKQQKQTKTTRTDSLDEKSAPTEWKNCIFYEQERKRLRTQTFSTRARTLLTLKDIEWRSK